MSSDANAAKPHLYHSSPRRKIAFHHGLLKCFVDKNTIKASDPVSFNAPFEFKIVLDLKADEPTKRSRYFADNPSSTDLEYKHWRDGLDQATWGITQETRKARLSEFGVLCLSAIGDNHLMWSHYASNHRGFCVGLDENQISAIPEVSGHGSVVYENEAPIFRIFYDDQTEFARKALAYKSHSWGYEQEYRILFERVGIVTIPSSAIREIRLGCRAFPACTRHLALAKSGRRLPFARHCCEAVVRPKLRSILAQCPRLNRYQCYAPEWSRLAFEWI